MKPQDIQNAINGKKFEDAQLFVIMNFDAIPEPMPDERICRFMIEKDTEISGITFYNHSGIAENTTINFRVP